jgi:hypothetical protein
VIATVAVFAFAGALHDVVVVVLVPQWGPVITCAYLAFAWLSLLSLKFAPLLKQDTWPTFLNIVVNMGLIVGVFETSIRLFWYFLAGNS